jgi:hypothetical protein
MRVCPNFQKGPKTFLKKSFFFTWTLDGMADVALEVLEDVTRDLTPSEDVQENNFNDADGNSVEHVVML